MNLSTREHLHFAHRVHTGSSLVEFEVPLDRDSMNAFMEIWFFGAYDFLSPSPGSVVVDAGASVGLFTLKASEWVGESGRVIAVEPVPHNCEILSRNLARNKIRNVTVVQKAVSDISGKNVTVVQKAASDTSGKTEVYGNPVESITLDKLQEELGTDFPEAIKIDIEGSEVKALRGAKRTLAHARKLAFETHSKGLEREVRSLLTAEGFEVHEAQLNSMVTTLARSIALNPMAFAWSELNRVFSWRMSGGPFLFEPIRWLYQFRKPDWMNPESGLNLITAQKPVS